MVDPHQGRRVATRRLIEIIFGGSFGRTRPERDRRAEEDAHYSVQARDAPVQIEGV
jgi:hypothetical protein